MSAFNPQPTPAGFNRNWDQFLNQGNSSTSTFNGLGSSSNPWSLQNPSVNNSAYHDIQSLLPSPDRTWTYRGLGQFQEDPLRGPSAQQMWGGMLHDLNLQDQLNKENWMRNQAASDMFLRQSTEAARQAQTAGQAQWDKAAQFQQQGAQQAQEDFARLQGQLKAAQDKMAADKAEVGKIFDKATSTIGEGADRVASDAAAAIQRRKESDVDQIRAQMGEFAGTEAQIDEAARRRAGEYDRDLFGTVANLQYKSAADKAAVMQNKGQIFAQLANSTAGIGGQFAQMEFGAAESRNKWNQFGADIAMANAKFASDAAQAHAQLTSMNYKSYADMVARNPVLGVSITPTLLGMAEAAKRYGGEGRFVFPNMIRPVDLYGGIGSGNMYDYGGTNFGHSMQTPQEMLGGFMPGAKVSNAPTRNRIWD